MGSETKSDTKTTTQNLTPEQQQLVSASTPFYSQFAASSPTLPGAAGISPFDPLQTQGQGEVLSSTGQAKSTVDSANAQNQYFTSGALLDPDNPATQGAIRAAVRPISDNLRDVALPGIAADASTSGSGGISANFGGSRQGVAEGLAVRDATNKIGDVGASIANQARQSGLQATLAAIGQAPTIAASSTIPGTITSTVGDVRQQQAQNLLSADNSARSFQDWLPLLKAQMLTQGAGALPGGSATSVGTSNTSPNPFQMILGGASAAGGAAGGISKLLPFLML